MSVLQFFGFFCFYLVCAALYLGDSNMTRLMPKRRYRAYNLIGWSVLALVLGATDITDEYVLAILYVSSVVFFLIVGEELVGALASATGGGMIIVVLVFFMMLGRSMSAYFGLLES